MVFFRYPSAFLLFLPVIVYVLYIISKNFIKFKDKKELEEYNKKNKRARTLLIISKLVIFSLIIFALASPTVVEEKTLQGDLSLALFVDNSTSFSVFDGETVKNLKEELDKEIPTNIKTIARGTRSAIGDGIMNNIEKDENVLIISDGNNNYGRNLADIIILANNLNVTINSLNIAPIKSDTIVSISGPSEEIIGSESLLKVNVEQIGKAQSYILRVDIDGNLLLDVTGMGNNEYTINEQLAEGYHQVTAKVIVDDHFEQNDVYYKTVHILSKPTILMVTRSSSALQGALGAMYNIIVSEDIPRELDQYSAVILNNYPQDDIGLREVEILTNYVTDGNGLFVVGGNKAYDRGKYSDSQFETLLPVKSGTGDPEQSKDVNIVLVLDISESSGGSFSGGKESKADVMKALAISTIDSIKKEDNVAVVAFNTDAYLISALSPLSSKSELPTTIAKLRPGGGTDITQGIYMGMQLLRNAKGSKNIILISDGITFDPQGTLRMVAISASAGIKVYSVGVGMDTFVFLMNEIARFGKGIYFKPTQAEKLKILFGDPEDDENKKENLIILNNNHFITESLSLDGKVAGYNQVVPKSSAELLVTTGDGKPILTVWRFGLGRVASLSTDDGTSWAGPLLSQGNSKILTRALNWVIGNPGRNSDFAVEAEDTTIDESVQVIVKSDKQPISEDIRFNKEDDDLYVGTFTPKQTGFYDLVGASVAVNYEKEYLKLGLNPQLRDLVTITGGEMFNKDDINKIIKRVKSTSTRTESRNVSYRWPFAIVALALFLIEIFVRRIRENSRSQRG